MTKIIKFVDLSLEIKEGFGDLPPDSSNLAENLFAKVKHSDHKDNISKIEDYFPGISAVDLPDGLTWADDYLSLGVHICTHMDAPWHYYPSSQGKKLKTLDKIPLEYCFSDGVILDITHKKPGELINLQDMKKSLKKVKL
ncbi:MAG: cyclase family protein [Candidatus Thorarchaeota archaeon]